MGLGWESGWLGDWKALALAHRWVEVSGCLSLGCVLDSSESSEWRLGSELEEGWA